MAGSLDSCFTCIWFLKVGISVTLFPAAKIVKFTRTDPALRAFYDIYTNFGTPETRRTDNGLPFNSQQFKEYLDAKGVKQSKFYSYHLRQT